MKKVLITIGILIFGLAAAAYGQTKLQAPHNVTNNIDCSDCHQFGSFPSQDATCLSCHTNDTGGGYSKNSAPKVQTHSAAVIGDNKYGNWVTQCYQCHEPHDDKQYEFYPSNYPNGATLVSGTITSATDNGDGTSTIGYSNPTVLSSQWTNPATWGKKTGNDRGLILVANPNDYSVSFEIISATSNQMLVNGSINSFPSGSVTVSSQFRIIYGQYIGAKTIIDTSINLSTSALFFNQTGQNSFAYNENGTGNDPTPYGICQVCHTQTAHWRSNGTLADHNSGAYCANCHPHKEGFKPAGCDTCHGFPPITNSTTPPPAGTPATGLVNNPSPTGSNSAGVHSTHAGSGAGSYGFSCDKCHDGGMVAGSVPQTPIPDLKIEIGFNISSSYQSGKYDGRTSLSSPYVYAAGNPGTIVTNNGSLSCTSIYCHSNGKVGTSVETYATPVWTDGPLTCTACHGQPPSYANGGAGTDTANSHPIHVTTNGYGCEVCHNKTTTDGSTVNVTFHDNTVADVYFDSTNPNGAYTAQTKTCSTLTCHGSGSPQWGGTVRCQDCHLSTNPDVDNFTGTFWDNGIRGNINSGEWNSTGHGATAPYASGNPGAGFPTANEANGCTYCHDSTVGHKNSANPFRLRNITNGTWGKNGVCQNCHATGSAGITVDNVNKNGTKKIGSFHYGTKHSSTLNGGQFCWDCHDPHGDDNVYMVQHSVAMTSDATTGAPTAPVVTSFTAFSTGTDYVKTSSPYNGVCQVCHTTTNHWRNDGTLGGHNQNIRCTNCHKHTDPDGTTTAGFKPFGNNCFDCHSSAGGPTPGTTPDPYHAKHIQTPYVGQVSAGDYGNYSTNTWYRYANTGGVPDMGCGYCHPQSSATHMNGVINLNFDPNDGGATGTLKAKDAPTQTFIQNTRVNVVCQSVYCHSNGYSPSSGTVAGDYGYQSTPNWYGGSYAGDKCAGCHTNSPTGSSTHAKHVVGIHYNNIYTGTTGLATPGNTPTSSHGNAATSTTLNCNVCHNNTVTMSANDRNTICVTCHTGGNLQGTMVIAAASTTHVNGTVDVAFAAIQVKSKAQLRDDITTVPELNNNWTRNGGYKASGSFDSAKNALNTSTYVSGTKTCNNVACHNGMTITWTATNISCNACHTALPQ